MGMRSSHVSMSCVLVAISHKTVSTLSEISLAMADTAPPPPPPRSPPPPPPRPKSSRLTTFATAAFVTLIAAFVWKRGEPAALPISRL